MAVDLHLPDLDFVRQTEATFQINRGVYNTIDGWFYAFGLDHIVERRGHITTFLHYAQQKARENQVNQRMFYPEGLTKSLEEYTFVSQVQKKQRETPKKLISLLDN